MTKSVELGLAALLSAAISGGCMWIGFVQHTPTRDEMHEYVQSSAPYVKDKAVVDEKIKHEHELILRVERQLEKLAQTTETSLLTQQRLMGKMDQLLDQKRN